MLSTEELERYARQLPIIGCAGQQDLRNAHVLMVGAGGLGAPVALYLTAAGVGRLTIMDGDQVERSNLQRQVLFQEKDVGKNKALCMRERLRPLNSHCDIHAFSKHLDELFSIEQLGQCNVLVDATDNYQARYLMNHFSHRMSIPLVSAALYQFEGQLSVFNYDSGPCYQCLYPAPPDNDVIPDCAQGGILGAVAGMVGCLQASEVIKVILRRPDVLSGKLLQLNVARHYYKTFQLNKHPDCAKLHGTLASPVEEQTTDIDTISATRLQQELHHQPELYQLLDVREAYEREICSLGGLFIPLHSLNERMASIPRDKTLVVYCKKGGRSHKAAATLKEHGFRDVLSLEGGILQWITEIDQEMQRY